MRPKYQSPHTFANLLRDYCNFPVICDRKLSSNKKNPDLSFSISNPKSVFENSQFLKYFGYSDNKLYQDQQAKCKKLSVPRHKYKNKENKSFIY